MESWREELYHHGIKGQKWGVRRFQNEDGSLTTKGKSRYGYPESYEKSKNVLLGRKIGASEETGKAHGERLRNKGKNTGKIIAGRAVKNAAIGAAWVAGSSLLAKSTANCYDLASFGKRQVATMALNGVMAGLMASNIVGAYQDIRDIHTYDKSKK